MNTDNAIILLGCGLLAAVMLGVCCVIRWCFQRKRNVILYADCALCGKRFVATPDSFVEVGWDAETVSDEQAETLEVPALEFMTSAEIISLLNQQEPNGVPLDAAALRELMENGTVDTGAQTWCAGCRKKHFGIDA